MTARTLHHSTPITTTERFQLLNLDEFKAVIDSRNGDLTQTTINQIENAKASGLFCYLVAFDDGVFAAILTGTATEPGQLSKPTLARAYGLSVSGRGFIYRDSTPSQKAQENKALFDVFGGGL